MAKKITNKKKSKKEENKKKRIIYLFVLLSLLIVLLTSVTYAWFSSNKRAMIDAMDINVATISGIQVSVDGINWSNEVKKDDILGAFRTYPSATNQLPDTLAGCSTDGSVGDGKLNLYFGMTRQHDQDYYLTTTKQEEINCVGDEECVDKHYIAFDLFFLVSEPQDIVVTSESSVLNRSDVDDGGQNSARVAFVNLGTITDTASGKEAQYLKQNHGSIIWEPNYDVHTAYGIKNALEVYGITTYEMGGTRIPYKGVNTEITGKGVNIKETNNSPYFTLVTPEIATTKVFTADQPLTRLQRGITKMRIYLWLEGQDVDLEDNAADGRLQFNLEIAIANR